jgi:hypothetical protein
MPAFSRLSLVLDDPLDGSENIKSNSAHQDLSFDIQHENLSRILIGFALHCTVD